LSAVQARWAAKDSMHITLRFFGPTDDTQIELLGDLVTSLAEGAPPLLLRAAAVTGFPSAARARILVVELADEPLLSTFAQRAEATAIALGFAPETRAYRPHLTLARMKENVDVRGYAGEAALLPLAHATAVTLYSSTTGPRGPVYTSLARATLPAP
jgi:2'-5' RNA ligase